MSKKPHLIVVDDEPDSVVMIAELAESIGFKTDIIDNPKRFLREWSSQDSALFIIDLCMPDTDGIEILQALAKKKCTTAIIIVSGFDSCILDCSGDYAKALNLNMLGTFSKPFYLDDIKPLLQNIHKQFIAES